MAVTATVTARTICTDALRKIGVVSKGEAAAADDISVAQNELDRMLKSWQANGFVLWTKAGMSQTLTTAASYTLTPVRPIRILSARYKGTNGIEIPMFEMTRDEYDELPDKTATGTPTQFYYDRQREAALFYVWPVLSSATTESVEITYERELEDVDDLDNTLDVPGEAWDAVVYGLASRLADDYEVNAPRVVARAEYLYSRLLGSEREGSVYFMAERR